MITKVIFIAFVLFITGCHSVGFLALDALSYNKDVSGNYTLWGGFKINQVLKLKHNMFVSRKETWHEHFAIVPPQEINHKKRKLYNSPENILSYQQNNEEWPDVIGIIKAETLIKCSGLIQLGRYGGESIVEPYGTIISGPYAGIVVEISELAIFTKAQKEDLSQFSISPDVSLIAVDGPEN